MKPGNARWAAIALTLSVVIAPAALLGQKASSVSASVDVAKCVPVPGTITVPAGSTATGFAIVQLLAGNSCATGAPIQETGFSIQDLRSKHLFDYSWTPGTPPPFSAVQAVTLKALTLGPGTYQVWVNGGRGANVLLSYSLTGGAAPPPPPPPVPPAVPLTISITSTAASVRVGQAVTTQSAVSGGRPPYTYAWFDGATRSNVTSSSVNWTPNAAGAHVYKVVVTDAAGATTQAQTTIQVATATSPTPVPPPPPPPSTSTNLALHKPATQSSTYGSTVTRGTSFGAGMCVDGSLTSGICNTNRETNPWWQVDLGGNYALTQIVVYNRTDQGMGVRERTIHALLSTDGRNWTLIYAHNGTDFQVLKINAGGRTARYVRLQLAATDWMNLVEVEVYGAGAPQPNPMPPPQQLLLPLLRTVVSKR
jgi:hypothetical protein